MRGRARRLVVVGLSAAVAIAGPWTPGSAARPDERAVDEIVPGVRLIRLTWEEGPIRAFVLRVDLSAGPVTGVTTARSRYPLTGASVPELAEREDSLAAVNGDLGGFRPIHAFVDERELVQTGVEAGVVLATAVDGSVARIGRPHLRVRAVFDGDVVRIAHWNSGDPRGREIVGYSPAGGIIEAPSGRSCSVQLGSLERPEPLPGDAGMRQAHRVMRTRCGARSMEVGDGVVLTSRRSGAGARWIRSLERGATVVLSWRSRWPGVTDMQGGRPTLLLDGQLAFDLPCRLPLCPQHPRTGVGVSEGCEDEDASTRCLVFLVVVDGRQSGWSVGMRLLEFARLFRRIGASSAVNMDGGGSSTMVIRGAVVNRPSLGDDREVPTAFLVFRGAASRVDR